MLRILHDTKIDFIRHWRIAAMIVAAFVVPALGLILWKGFNYSVEFTGGTLMYVEFTQPTDAADVRSALSTGGVNGAEIASFGSAAEYTIRARDEADVTAQANAAESVATRITQSLETRFGAGSFVVNKIEAVGPKVGSELRQTSAVALLIAFGLTLVYLAWRFEWRFGVASVLATVHDILVTFAFIFYANLEISVFTIGAMLTVIGYSLNDKVVVFDRVRENLVLHRKMSLYDLLNRSVNETLPRTIMTGSTTLATLLALLIFGGEVIRDFAAILIVGILVGTFSSIYVAAPLLLYIERRWPHDVGDRNAVGPISKSALKGGPAKA